MAVLSHLYLAMWSNMWAPSVWTLFGIGVSHLAHHRGAERRQDDLKAHTTSELERLAPPQGGAVR